MTTTKSASARRNHPYGWKALVVTANERGVVRTLQPVRHNFYTRDLAVAYAQKWIDANAARATPVSE